MTREERLQVSQYILTHPDRTYRQIAQLVGCHHATIRNIASEFGVRRRPVRSGKPISEILAEAVAAEANIEVQ